MMGEGCENLEREPIVLVSCRGGKSSANLSHTYIYTWRSWLHLTASDMTCRRVFIFAAAYLSG